MGSRAENSKLLIMAGSFQWLAPSRSPPRVTSSEQKTLLSSRRWQGFQEFYPGTGSRDWYTFSITSTYTLHWDTQSLSKGIQLTDSFKRIKFNHQHPHISFFFFLFTATLAAYGRSQTRSWIGAATATCATVTAMLDLSPICELCCSLQPRRILNPLNEARDRTCILTGTTLGS